MFPSPPVSAHHFRGIQSRFGEAAFGISNELPYAESYSMAIRSFIQHTLYSIPLSWAVYTKKDQVSWPDPILTWFCSGFWHSYKWIELAAKNECERRIHRLSFIYEDSIVPYQFSPWAVSFLYRRRAKTRRPRQDVCTMHHFVPIASLNVRPSSMLCVKSIKADKQLYLGTCLDIVCSRYRVHVWTPPSSVHED